MSQHNDRLEEVYVGLDYHQDPVQVCVMDHQGQVLANRPVENVWQAVVKAACGRPVRRAAVESCCGAADLADELVQHAGWSVELAHPGYVARMKRSPDKHDMGDSQLLADLTRVGYLPRVWLAPPPLRELRRLVRYCEQLKCIRRDAKLRIGALLREHRIGGYAGCRWTLRWQTWLHRQALPAMPDSSRWIVQRQLLQVELSDREIVRVHSRLREVTADDVIVSDLRSQAGVGEWTAWVLRAEIGQFDRFRSGKSLSRYCGISPRNASSGQRQADAGLIKAGSPLLRATLIELAQRLCRMPGRWREMKLSFRSAGKPASLATAAVANRWMRWLYHEMLGRQRQRREQTATAVVQEDNRMTDLAARQEFYECER